MVVTQRKKAVGNVEDLDQTKILNGQANRQVRRQDSSIADRKLNDRKISSVAKRYFKLVSFPIECLVCAIAVFYIILFLFPVLAIYNILKFVERKLVYFKYGYVAMSGQDALWLQDTKGNRLIINGANVMECSDIQHLVDGVRKILLRCISMKNDKGQPMYPRFVKCIHPGVFQYFLKPPDNFDINEHVYCYEGMIPKSHDEMEVLISTLSSQEITFDSPPWQFIIIPKTYDGNEAILLFRMHHGMADGVSLTRFFLEHFPDKPLTDNSLVKFSTVDRKWLYLNALLTGSRKFFEKLFCTPDSSIIHGPALKGVKKMSWSQPISLGVVKKIKNYTGTTVNDVLMACISMSFHDYFKAHGISNPPDIKVLVPVDIRRKGQSLKLENDFAVVSLKLPASKNGALENLYATKAHMDDVKHSGEAFAVAVGANTSVECMPDTLSNFLQVPIANKHSCVLSNVPGAQESFSISGHKVTHIFFSPPQRNLIGIGIGVYSYAGEFSISVQSDLNCMEDPKWIVKAFQSRIAQLEKCVISIKGQIESDSGIE